ncbi:MAG TPA: class I SAM-dependent methyltransferase [Candidatus Krumholzibacteria bacterium]
MTKSAGEFFGEIAGEYDSIARRGMPCYEELLEALAGCLPDGPTDLLELGCGTGALTRLLAERYSEAKLRAVDAAPEMIELAQARLVEAGVATAGMIADTSFGVAQFETLSLPERSYDLIASNMSLHHVEDKEPFYTRLRLALRPGGLLVFGDELKGAHAHVEERHWNAWLDYARAPGHLSEEEVARIVRHSEEIDHYETLPRQLELLRAAGFDPVDCVWRYLNYAVFVAQA